MHKILIIGIESFTGEYLSAYLRENNYEVYGTSLFENGTNQYKCDITKKEDILNVLKTVTPEFIIHLSGISFSAHDKNEDFYRVNTIGTTNILEALLELNQTPSKIILASSATVYGNQGVEVLDETLCPKPANHYGASKYAMECLASGYFNKLPIMIVRPFNYTGIGQAEQFLIPKIVQHYKDKKETIELGNIDVSREFNDISYVCEVYKNLLENSSKSEVVNICSNRGIKLLDIIEIMNEIAGYRIKIDINQAFVRKDEIKSLTGSTEKLFETIDYIEQVDLRTTLTRMFEI